MIGAAAAGQLATMEAGTVVVGFPLGHKTGGGHQAVVGMN